MTRARRVMKARRDATRATCGKCATRDGGADRRARWSANEKKKKERTNDTTNQRAHRVRAEGDRGERAWKMGDNLPLRLPARGGPIYLLKEGKWSAAREKRKEK